MSLISRVYPWLVLALFPALTCLYFAIVVARAVRGDTGEDLHNRHIDSTCAELIRAGCSRKELLAALRSDPHVTRRAVRHRFCAKLPGRGQVAVWREYRDQWLFPQVVTVLWDGEMQCCSYGEFERRYPEAQESIPF